MTRMMACQLLYFPGTIPVSQILAGGPATQELPAYEVQTVPSEIVTDTSYSFTLNGVNYILETSLMHTAQESDKWVLE